MVNHVGLLDLRWPRVARRSNVGLVNPSHTSTMILHFTEPPMYILNHDVDTLLPGFCTKVFLYCILE